MDIQSLQNFLCLVRLRNFSRAAQQANLTQSALSRRIKALEEWVGAPLIDRTVHPVAPTPAGVEFFELVTEFEERVEIFRSLAARNRLAEERTLNISAIHTLALAIVPGVVMQIEEALPGTLCAVSANDHQRCVEALNAGEADMMFSFSLPDCEGGVHAVIGHDALVPVSAPDDQGSPLHRLGGNGQASPETVCPETVSPETVVPGTAFLSYGEGAMLQQALEASWRDRGVQPVLRPVFKNSMTEVLRRCAQAGFGLAWLPRSMVADDIAHGVLVPAGGPEWSVALDIHASRSVLARSPLVDDVWAVITAGRLGNDASQA